MSAGNPLMLVFNGASICKTPTDMFAAGGFPFGGTALGLCKNVVVRSGRKVVVTREESLGPMPFNGVDLGEAWGVAGTFRTYDADMIQALFANTGVGASSGFRQITYPGSYTAGGLLSNLGAKYLIAPDEYEYQGRFFYAYNGVLLAQEGGEMPYQRGEEWVVPFRIICLPDASNRVAFIGVREDLQALL